MNNLKSKKLIIFGNAEFAEVAYVYFMHDTDYEVCGFTVEEKFLSVDKCSLFNLPIVPFEDLEKYFPHSKYEIFIAIAYKKMNRIREKFATISEFKGYKLASYISTNALISPNVHLGKNIFILESNVIQPFSEISDGVVLWSGNHIGHHSKVGKFTFIASQVVVSGNCTIGKNCFLGVNASIGDGVLIGDDNWISPGVVITQSTDNDSLWPSAKAQRSKVRPTIFFKVEDKKL